MSRVSEAVRDHQRVDAAIVLGEVRGRRSDDGTDPREAEIQDQPAKVDGISTMTDDTIHEAACRAGATIMGAKDAPRHYIMNADELRRFLALAIAPPTAVGPPCPVPLPSK